MSRFRLLLAWLMMAALPLQGWAAASMLYCGPAQRAAVAQAHSTGAGDHGGHAMHVDHHDRTAGHHDMTAGHPATADVDPEAVQGGTTVDASSHTCGVCASCCHGVALAQTQRWAACLPAPAAETAEPLIPVLARPSPVPDKPPRA
jgi:hypothetical protein